MTGYIKLEVIDAGNSKRRGVSGDVNLMHVSEFDKVILLDAFMQGLHMSDEDVFMALLMRDAGVIHISSEVSVDVETLKKMREIKDGGEK